MCWHRPVENYMRRRRVAGSNRWRRSGCVGTWLHSMAFIGANDNVATAGDVLDVLAPGVLLNAGAEPVT